MIATESAITLIERLREKYGALIFHQSGGCCDGSSPMCYPEGDLIIGESDVLIGDVGDCPFYMSRSQFEYWQHTQITLDVIKGRGGMFSLEGPEGLRFFIRSRLFTKAESLMLSATS
ncbi:MAG: DUF779 domain-containing protein [Methylococcus sp.]